MEANCTICLDRLKYPHGKPDSCEHKFCFNCISGWLKQRSECPLCGRTPKYLIKTEETKEKTKVPVKKRTAKQFENELLVRDQLEDYSGSLGEVEDITIAYASCRVCKRSDNEHLLLLCDGNVGRNADGSMIRCNVAYHSYCLPEKLDQIPEGDWFCPFCADKPENAQYHPMKQTSSKVLSTEAGTSGLSKLDSHQNSESHPVVNVKQDDVKIESIECTSIASSKSTAFHGDSGGSDAESDYTESDGSCYNSDSYSRAGDSTNDDDYGEGRDQKTVTQTSNERSDDDSETDNVNGSSSDTLDDEDDNDDVDDNETDESDSVYNLIQPMFPGGHGRTQAKSPGRKTRFVGRITRFRAKTTSKGGGYCKNKATIMRQECILTRRHST